MRFLGYSLNTIAKVHHMYGEYQISNEFPHSLTQMLHWFLQGMLFNLCIGIDTPTGGRLNFDSNPNERKGEPKNKTRVELAQATNGKRSLKWGWLIICKRLPERKNENNIVILTAKVRGTTK